MAATLAGFAGIAPSPAGAQSATSGAASVEGRWRSERPALTLDVARCNEGYCGMAVDAAGRCGAPVLTFGSPAASVFGEEGSGRLRLPDARTPLDARVALLLQPSGTAILMIVAVEPGSRPLSYMRRTFPFEARMARIGDASCATRPVS
jgi:hypothetical protein